MAEEYAPQQFSIDFTGKIRDMEEKQKLLKDRVLLLGQSIIEERSKSLKETQETKKTMFSIVEENTRMKELLERITEQLGNVARKEELLILQRQLDLLRK